MQLAAQAPKALHLLRRQAARRAGPRLGPQRRAGPRAHAGDAVPVASAPSPCSPRSMSPARRQRVPARPARPPRSSRPPPAAPGKSPPPGGVERGGAARVRSGALRRGVTQSPDPAGGCAPPRRRGRGDGRTDGRAGVEGRLGSGRNSPQRKREEGEGEGSASPWRLRGDRLGTGMAFTSHPQVIYHIRSFLGASEDSLSLPPRAPTLLYLLSGKNRKVLSPCQWLFFPYILHVPLLPK